MQNFSPGTTLGKYELRDMLGAGGMGAVYRAYDHSLKREVAVKVINLGAGNAELQARFIREAQTAANLEHSHIVRIYDYGVERDINYVVMQNLTGGSLSERMKQAALQGRPRASLPEVALLLEQIASALDYAHAQGVVHRDIKPQNVMFDNQGQAFLVDFGIAKLLTGATNLTGTNMAMGTPSYMPPEQWSHHDLTPAADQYALAVMTYQLIAGRLPFEADSVPSLWYKIENEQPTPLTNIRADVPRDLVLVIGRAMSKRPSERFPNCTQFAQAFASAVSGLRTDSTNYFTFKLAKMRPSEAPATPLPSVTPPLAKTPTQITIPLPGGRSLLVAGIGVLVVLVLFALLWNNRGPSESELRLTDVNRTLVAAGLATDSAATRTSGLEVIATETPEPTPTPAKSPSEPSTATIASTETPTASATASETQPPAVTPSETLTLTITNTASPTATVTPSTTATATDTASPTATDTETKTPTDAPTFTPSLSPREAALATLDTGATQTASHWTATPSTVFTSTEAIVATINAEFTALYFETQTAAATLWTATLTPSFTPTVAPSLSPTMTPTTIASPALTQPIVPITSTQVDTPVFSSTQLPDPSLTPLHNTSLQSEGMTILLIGIDQRPLIETGSAYRADAISVVYMDFVRKRIRLLGFPRDLRVSIPGFGEQSINAANLLGEISGYPGGGAALIAATLEEVFGLHVDRYVRMNFDAFVELIDRFAPGGLEFCITSPMDDLLYPDDSNGTKAIHFDAGCQLLDGARVLQYVRTRNTPNGDMDRIVRQQEVLRTILARFLSLDTGVGSIDYIAAQYAPFITSVETNLAWDELISLAQLVAEIPPEQITSSVIDFRFASLVQDTTGEELLIPNIDLIRDLIQDIFYPDQSHTIAELRVLAESESASISIFNDSEVPGLAGLAREWLIGRGVSGIESVGYLTPLGNGFTRIRDYTGNSPWTVRYLASLLGISLDRIEAGADALVSSDILVVVGADSLPLLSGFPTATPFVTPSTTDLAATQPTATSSGDQPMVTVSVESANLREGPGTNYAVAGAAVEGEIFLVIGQAQDWYLIEQGNGSRAWISETIVDLAADGQEIPIVEVLGLPTQTTSHPTDSPAESAESGEGYQFVRVVNATIDGDPTHFTSLVPLARGSTVRRQGCCFRIGIVYSHPNALPENRRQFCSGVSIRIRQGDTTISPRRFQTTTENVGDETYLVDIHDIVDDLSGEILIETVTVCNINEINGQPMPYTFVLNYPLIFQD